MISTRNILGSALAAAMFLAPMAAQAVTVTVTDEIGTDVTATDPLAVTNAMPTREYNVEIEALFGDIGSTFSEVRSFTNSSSSAAFVSVATLLSASDFANAALTVTGIVGGPISISLDGAENTFAIAAGATATFTAEGTVLSRGNFDYNVGAVPLPAAGFMLITALGGLGLARRKKKVS